MKKGLLGLVVAALTIVGCQNYDDQFDDLNTKIATLQSSVNDLDGIQTAVGALSTKLDQLANSALTDADLIDILDEVAEVKAAVNAIDVSGIEAEVTDLENEVDEILERLNELLAANAVIMGDIVIRNEGDLLVAEDLIGTEADDPLVTIQGNVLIEITGTSSFTEAANVARVNAVMAKLKIVQGTVTVTTSKALAMPELMYVSGDFNLTQNTGGSAPSAKLRTINGTFNFTGGGDVNYSQLANAAGVNITTNAVTLTSIDFGGLGGSGKVLTGTNSLVLPSALSVRVGGVLPEVVTLVKATSFESTYNGAAQTTSTIHVGGAAATFSINSTKFTGAVSITSTGDVNLANVTSVKGLTVTASDTANLSGITAFTAQATLTAANVDVSAWKSNTHTITINTDTTITAPALTTLTGDLVASSATVFDAPKLKTTTGTIDLKNNALLTVHLESLDYSSTPTATILDFSNVKLLKVTKQKGTTDLDVSLAASLTTLDYTRAEVTPKGSGKQSNTLSLTSSNTKLTTLSLAGYLGSFTASNTKLTSIDTTGAFIVTTNLTSNTALTGLTFAHGHVQGDDASDVIIKNNPKITTLNLSSLAKVQTVEVTGNAALTSIVAPSASVLATSVATITVTINSNKLSGTYTKASAPTGTVSYQPASISAAVLTSFKPWIEANVNVDLNAPIGTKDRTLTGSASSTSTASGNGVIYNINLDNVTTVGSTTTGTLTDALNGDPAAQAGPDTIEDTADDQTDNEAGNTSGVNTKNELDMVSI